VVDHEKPFLKEEEKLLEAISLRLSSTVMRRRSDDNSHYQQELFQTIVEQAAEAIALVDIESLRIIETNQSACEPLGYSREELLSLSLADIQGELDEETIRDRIKIVIERDSASFPTLRKRKDGSTFEVQASLKVVTLRGKQLLSSVWMDMTAINRSSKLIAESEIRFRKLFMNPCNRPC